jgi:Flp pilus assembly protein TadD
MLTAFFVQAGSLHGIRIVRGLRCGLRLVLASVFLALVACATAPETFDPAKKEVAVPVMADDVAMEEFSQALALLKANDYEAAITKLQRVVEKEKRFAAPYVNLGMAYSRKGDYIHAEEVLNKALELQPGQVEANNELGMLYRKTGRFNEARSAYERALNEQPAYLPARRNLGILCEIYLGDLNCALEQYQHYLEVVPDDKNVNIWLTELKRRMGQ